MKLLTIPEVARVLRVREPRAYQLARDVQIPVVSLGRQVRVDEAALREWVINGGRPLTRQEQNVAK